MPTIFSPFVGSGDFYSLKTHLLENRGMRVDAAKTAEALVSAVIRGLGKLEEAAQHDHWDPIDFSRAFCDAMHGSILSLLEDCPRDIKNPVTVLSDIISDEVALTSSTLNYSASTLAGFQRDQLKEFCRLAQAVTQLTDLSEANSEQKLTTVATQIGFPEWDTRTVKEVVLLVGMRLLGTAATATLSPAPLTAALTASDSTLRYAAFLSLCCCAEATARGTRGNLGDTVERNTLRVAHEKFVEGLSIIVADPTHGNIPLQDFVGAFARIPDIGVMVARKMVLNAAQKGAGIPTPQTEMYAALQLIKKAIDASPLNDATQIPVIRENLLGANGEVFWDSVDAVFHANKTWMPAMAQVKDELRILIFGDPF